MPESNKYRSDRFSITLRKPVSEAVRRLAEREERTLSQMIGVLVEEAIKTRTENELQP
jgi:hypothetical protein